MPTPFLPVSVCLTAGILCGRNMGNGVLIGSLLLAASLACGWLFFGLRRNALVAAFLLLAVFSLGALRSRQAHSDYLNHPLRLLCMPDYADFEGRLARSPSQGAGKTELIVLVDGVRHRKRFRRLCGRVRFIVLGDTAPEVSLLRRLRPGDRVNISARLSARRGFLNFGQAASDRRLELQSLHQTAFSKSALLVTRTAEGSKLDPRRWAASLRRRLLDKIEEVFRDSRGSGLNETGAVLEAILLGERGHLHPDTLRSLRESGLFHLIAISGAHIAVFSGLLHFLLTAVRIPRRASALLLILFLAFYALVVEGRASVLRAVIMSSLYLLGRILWRDVRLLNTVSLSAFLLLLWHPMSLWEPGFQLTFAATISIILFAPRILRKIPRLPLRLPELIAASLAAHLGVTPVLAAAFNRVVLSGLVLNLAAVPLMAAVMSAGYAFLVAAHIHPLLGRAAGWAVKIPVQAFLLLSRLPGQTPPFSYRLPSPPPIVLGLYVLLLLSLLFPRGCKGKGRTAAGLRLLLFLAAFAALAAYPFPARRSPGLRVTFLDVGQGEAILVEFPGRKKMLVDGGGLPGGDFDVGESVVSPCLWRAGMKGVDILVSTHAHSDHIGGLCAVARNFRVGEAWETAAPVDDAWQRRFRRSLRLSVPVRRPGGGDAFFISGVLVEVLHPPASDAAPRDVDNESSLVLRLTYGRVSMLLTSDIGRDSEGWLIRRNSFLESVVLKAAHHGSDTSTTAEFLEQVRPRMAVISSGEGNAFGLPGRAVLERLRRAGVRVFRTDLDGAVEVSSDGRSVQVRTAARIDDRPYLIYIESEA